MGIQSIIVAWKVDLSLVAADGVVTSEVVNLEQVGGVSTVDHYSNTGTAWNIGAEGFFACPDWTRSGTGDLTPIIQHSPDGANWYELVNFGALGADGAKAIPARAQPGGGAPERMWPLLRAYAGSVTNSGGNAILTGVGEWRICLG